MGMRFGEIKFECLSEVNLKLRCLLLTVVAFCTGLFVFGTVQAQSAVSTRYAQLARGVNIPIWFWLSGDAQPEHFEGYITATDADLLHRLGITHVRIPIDVNLIFDPEQPGELLAENLNYLGNAVQMLLDHQLAVILVPYGDTAEFISDPAYLDVAMAFWREFATYWSHFDPEKVFLEVVHEPAGPAAQWWSLQGSILAQMRLGAPEHTLIATPSQQMSEVDSNEGSLVVLTNMIPYEDPNIIYSVPFFEPIMFTLQGADWAGWLGALQDIPYPSSPANVEGIATRLQAEITDEALRWIPDSILEYGRQSWNRTTLERTLTPALAWAAQNNVPLLINEFGVYRDGGVSAEDRNRWLADVAEILERQGIGWTMWDYSDAFGLVVGRPNERHVDVDTARALGLELP